MRSRRFNPPPADEVRGHARILDGDMALAHRYDAGDIVVALIDEEGAT
jgi:hypothetical protein